MNDRILELAEQSGITMFGDAVYMSDKNDTLDVNVMKKFADLIIRECNQAVLSVPCYYKDYRSQIEESVINDCGRAVLEHFGVDE